MGYGSVNVPFAKKKDLEGKENKKTYEIPGNANATLEQVINYLIGKLTK